VCFLTSEILSSWIAFSTFADVHIIRTLHNFKNLKSHSELPYLVSRKWYWGYKNQTKNIQTWKKSNIVSGRQRRKKFWNKQGQYLKLQLSNTFLYGCIHRFHDTTRSKCAQNLSSASTVVWLKQHSGPRQLSILSRPALTRVTFSLHVMSVATQQQRLFCEYFRVTLQNVQMYVRWGITELSMGNAVLQYIATVALY